MGFKPPGNRTRPDEPYEYHIVLRNQKSETVASVCLNELPREGLLFEVGGTRWSVVEVSVPVTDTQKKPRLVECLVKVRDTWSEQQERWIRRTF